MENLLKGLEPKIIRDSSFNGQFPNGYFRIETRPRKHKLNEAPALCWQVAFKIEGQPDGDVFKLCHPKKVAEKYFDKETLESLGF